MIYEQVVGWWWRERKRVFGTGKAGNSCCFGRTEFEELQDSERTCAVGHWPYESGISNHGQGYSHRDLKQIHMQI